MFSLFLPRVPVSTLHPGHRALWLLHTESLQCATQAKHLDASICLTLPPPRRGDPCHYPHLTDEETGLRAVR